jgi:integrase/recombinase XerD
MNEEILNKYYDHLCEKYRKKQTIKNNFYYVKRCLEWINKPFEEITKDDLRSYRKYLVETFMPNGNARRLSSINLFVKWKGKAEYKLPVPKTEMSNKIVMSDEELDQYLETSKKDPLWHVIALFQIDGLLRPGEFRNIKLSNIDLINQKLYLDDTKTGNNYIIMSPRLCKAIKDYLPYRNPLPQYKDYLFTIPKGIYKGNRIGEQVTFIKNTTKRIASEAGITKKVTPYIVKPSVITNDFNKNINPRIIQRKARHKNIESTLRYDHTDDLMVKDHFKKISSEINIEDLSNEDKSKLMFDRYLNGEIDVDTLKRGLELLHGKQKDFEVAGYV